MPVRRLWYSHFEINNQLLKQIFSLPFVAYSLRKLRFSGSFSPVVACCIFFRKFFPESCFSSAFKTVLSFLHDVRVMFHQQFVIFIHVEYKIDLERFQLSLLVALSTFFFVFCFVFIAINNSLLIFLFFFVFFILLTHFVFIFVHTVNNVNIFCIYFLRINDAYRIWSWPRVSHLLVLLKVF